MIINQPLDVLQNYWGYEQFRPMQAEIIDSILEGGDTLALLPTGGGKSICYQVPALAQEGVCLVVSPLIALMKDQVEQLQARKISAQAIYSGMSRQEIDRHFDNAIYGNTKLLYVSPERLQTDLGQERISKMPLSFIAVDEAHCISQWGYDFRPSYLNIAEIRHLHPEVPILALTATATPDVIDDIQEKLEFQDGQVFQQSMERQNISMVVRKAESKEAELRDLLLEANGTVIVYARNRRLCEEITRLLTNLGISADYYHAGLAYEKRVQKQDAWMKGTIQVIVATNAFGMGIDKPDVRLVLHVDMPDSLEAYVQEAGRAGRDGNPSQAILLYQDSDIEKMYDWYRITYPSISAIRTIYQALCNYFQLAIGAEVFQALPFDLGDFSRKFGLSAVEAYHAIKVLQQDGWFNLTDSFLSASTAKVGGPRDEVYALQRELTDPAIVLQALLRLYEGVAKFPVPIKENDLAGFCDMSVSKIKEMLVYLDQSGIISYRSANDKPLLYWLRPRVPAGDLTIDMEAYRFRKDRHFQRIRSMELYAQMPVCRRNFILYYFGEKFEGRCGQCDVCRSDRVGGQSDPILQDRLMLQLRDLLSNGSVSLTQIREQCSAEQREEMAGIIDHLLREEILQQSSDTIFWKREQS